MNLCSIEGCERPVRVLKRGWCNRHYLRWRNHGDPLGGANYIAASPEEAFLDRTRWEGECLVWTGSGVRDYGRIRVGGKDIMAHRYSWERENGPIPEGFEVDHICHNPSCVFTGHLRLATRSENMTNRKGAPKSSSSGVRNVYWNKRAGKWAVAITSSKERTFLGYFEDLDEAERVAKESREDLFGEFAGRG